MYCPRLDHFIRLNQDGTIGKCGHMVHQMGFRTAKELEDSKWLEEKEEKIGFCFNKNISLSMLSSMVIWH